jgi:hypothetical protein
MRWRASVAIDPIACPRDPNPRPAWLEFVCEENNPHIAIGNEDDMLSADGLLMPAKKDEAPPDLRYFNNPRK